MLAQYKSKANLGIGVGFLIGFFGLITMAMTLGSKIKIGLALLVVGEGLMIWGACCYSKGKGYHPLLGLLLLLNLPGLCVLAFLPDKHEQPSDGSVLKNLGIIVGLVVLFVFLGWLMIRNTENSLREHGRRRVPNHMQESVPAQQDVPPPGTLANSLNKTIRVNYGEKAHTNNGIAGFIFVDLDGVLGADQAIKLLDSHIWELSEASKPGLFNVLLASGKIDGSGILQGLPNEKIFTAKRVWTSGDITAYIGDEVIGQGSGQVMTPQDVQKNTSSITPSGEKIIDEEADAYVQKLLPLIKSDRAQLGLKSRSIRELGLKGPAVIPGLEDALRHYQSKPGQPTADDKKIIALLEEQLSLLKK